MILQIISQILPPMPRSTSSLIADRFPPSAIGHNELSSPLLYNKSQTYSTAMTGGGGRTEAELIGICKKFMLRLRREMNEYLVDLDLDLDMYDMRALMAVAVAQVKLTYNIITRIN